MYYKQPYNKHLFNIKKSTDKVFRKTQTVDKVQKMDEVYIFFFLYFNSQYCLLNSLLSTINSFIRE